MGVSRQEYWSGLPCPSAEDLPHPEMEPSCLAPPAPAGGLFTTRPPGSPGLTCRRKLEPLLSWLSAGFARTPAVPPGGHGRLPGHLLHWRPHTLGPGLPFSPWKLSQAKTCDCWSHCPAQSLLLTRPALTRLPWSLLKQTLRKLIPLDCVFGALTDRVPDKMGR